MNALTQLELIAALLVGVVTLVMLLIGTSRSPKDLHDEIAHQLKQSTAVIDDFENSIRR